MLCSITITLVCLWVMPGSSSLTWPRSDWTLGELGEAAHLLHIEQSVRTC